MDASTPGLVDSSVLGLSPLGELTLPAVLLRGVAVPRDLVHVYLPSGPTVAFTARDLRSPGIVRATAIARAHGFTPGVRSPGGKMVAYDAGAVIVDHLSSTPLGAAVSGPGDAGGIFAANAAQHARVLGALAVPRIDTRVGEVPGEYCPGEYSVNVGGVVKVLGSAQRIVRRGSLFSTVIQVRLSDAVREVITEVSAALGYPLGQESMGALADFSPGLTPGAVRTALREDYRSRLGLLEVSLPAAAVTHARNAHPPVPTDLPFHVDDWTRGHPLVTPPDQDVAERNHFA